MELIYPEYYEKFHCIAGDCPDSCCKEWDVEVDADSAAYYRSLSGDLGERIRRNLYEEDGLTYLAFPGGTCPMQRADGLCGIQAELGEQALCQVCRRFPRISQDYGSFVELGIEMSCPEAARLMLEEDGWTLEHRQVPGGEAGDYDAEVLEILRRGRVTMMQILSDEQYAVNERLAQALLYGYSLQGEIDGGEETGFDPRTGLETAKKYALGGDPGALAAFYAGLEVLTDRWKRMLEAPRAAPLWTAEIGRFARYGMYRYFYQAVSDYDLVGRVKMVLAGCILTAFLGENTPESRVNTIQLYAKEIENDAENVDALMDAAYGHPALTDQNLLGLLLRV